MSTRTSYAEGTPSWTDLSTTDPDGARAFYGALFGWEFDANPVPDGGEYIMATLHGKSAAGMMQQRPEQAAMGLPSLWNTYITVEDLAATVAKVEGAGGTVMQPPMDVMDAGHMAVIVDPAGAVVALWQANQHIGSEIVNEPGAMSWNELITDDAGAALPFYKQVLGMDATGQDMGDGRTYTTFMVGENMVGGMLPPPMEGMPNHWSVYFAVEDIEETIAKATELGGQAMPILDIMPGRISAIIDPQGATFIAIQMTPPDAA